MKLATEHKALFCLLRAGLWEREPDDLSLFPLTDAEWWEVYRLAVRQTVAGIAYRGLHHLPEALLPGDELMMHWVAKADRIERANRQMNAVLCQLLQLMNRNDLHPVLLKGQGVAAFYEQPLLRECGDIDLYFPREGEERKATELMRQAGCLPEAQPDGSRSYTWQGVEIEHHTRLFDLYNPLLKGYLAALTGKHGFANQPLSSHPVETTEDAMNAHLPETGDEAATGKRPEATAATLFVPSPLLNLLLLNAHLMKHLAGHGIGLRQFCDMARAYHALRGSYSPAELESAYRRTGLFKWSVQLHTLLTEHLGLRYAALPYPGTDACTSPELLHIVLEGGNFGQYGETKGGNAQAGWMRKWRTFCSFWKRRGFSLGYSRGETFWISMRLIVGNLR